MPDRRRQWRAENQDIYIKHSLGKNTHIVSGSQGNEYAVELRPDSCSCPDWNKRSPEGGCKHILKVKLEHGMIDPLMNARTDFGSPNTSAEGSKSYSSDWSELSSRVKKRDGYKCQKCGGMGAPDGNADLHAHHIRPKSKGGSDEMDNLITLCRSCHEREHGHSIESSGTRKSSVDSPADRCDNQTENIPHRSNTSTDKESSAEFSREQDTSENRNTTTESQTPTLTSNSKETSNIDTTIADEPLPFPYGILVGIGYWFMITLILSAFVPPFFETADWKGGISLLIIGTLFGFELIVGHLEDHNLRRIRGFAGSVFCFIYGGVIFLF
jgi:hypothetical protein